MLQQLTIAIAGATGAVGREMLTCLEKRRFPHARLRLFASARSAGTTLPFAGRELSVEALTGDALAGVDIAPSRRVHRSRDIAPAAARHNCVIIDNLGLPHGPGRAAGRARVNSPRSSRPPTTRST